MSKHHIKEALYTHSPNLPHLGVPRSPNRWSTVVYCGVTCAASHTSSATTDSALSCATCTASKSRQHLCPPVSPRPCRCTTVRTILRARQGIRARRRATEPPRRQSRRLHAPRRLPMPRRLRLPLPACRRLPPLPCPRPHPRPRPRQHRSSRLRLTQSRTPLLLLKLNRRRQTRTRSSPHQCSPPRRLDSLRHPRAPAKAASCTRRQVGGSASLNRASEAHQPPQSKKKGTNPRPLPALLANTLALCPSTRPTAPRLYR